MTTRCKSLFYVCCYLFSGEDIPLHLVETINLRDEVLNQRGLDRDEALKLARRSLAAGVARALSGVAATAVPAPPNGNGSDALPEDDGATKRRGDHPAPFPLPGSAGAAADIDAVLCRGCGTCARNCPQEAIVLHPRASGIPLARVVPGVCTICGRCLAVCPVGAPDIPLAGHRQVRAALAAAFAGERP